MLRMLENRIKESFASVSRLYAGEEGAPAGGGVSAISEIPLNKKEIEVSLDDGIAKTEESIAKEPISGTSVKDDDIENYLGSEKSNPNKLPLKKFDRRGKSKEDIDALIEAAGPDIFLPKEELVKNEQKAKEVAQNKDKQAQDVQSKAEEKKPEKQAPTTFDEVDFYKRTDVTQEEFVALPEKIQKKLVESYLAPKEDTEKYTKIETEYKTLKKDIKSLVEDPFIAARLEEIQSGKRYIADELPPIAEKEVETIDALLSAGDKDGARRAIDKLIADRASAAIKIERSISDARAIRREAEKDAARVFVEIGKLDKRLAGDIKTDNWSELNDQHADWEEFEKGPKKIVDFCVSNNITLEQVKKLGPNKLYKLISTEQGWDKQRDENIAKSSVDEFLKKLKNPPKATTIDHGKQSYSPVSGKTQTGLNRDQLIEEIASGNPHNFTKLLNANDGNPEMIRLLGEIRQAGERVGRERRKVVA